MAEVKQSDRNIETPEKAPTSTHLAPTTAHEINNPLESLLNLLYLLGGEALTEQGRCYLTLAQAEVKRIAEITRESLNNNPAHKEMTDISDLLRSVLDFYREKFNSCDIAVQGQYPSGVTIPVYPAQMRQVLSNLLLNAAEATPRGGKIRAHVSASRERSGQHRTGVRITVADNGCGIPASVLPQIFQESFSMKPGGHGIGLAMVKAAVKKHDGLLRMRSSVRSGRQGTAFSLFLPSAS